MSRYRKTDERAMSSYYMNDFNPNGSQSSSTLINSGRLSRGIFRSINDVVVADYEKRVANGEVIMNPVTLRKEIRSCPVETLTFGNHPVWGTRTFVGTMACEWSLPPPSDFDRLRSDMEAAAAHTLVRAFEKVNTFDFAGLVTLAEAKKTASMLTSPFSAARDLVGKMERRFRYLKGLKDGVKFLYSEAQVASRVWLEYRYGWKPIMYDIANICKSYEESRRQFGTKPERVVERAGWEGYMKRTSTSSGPVSGLTSLSMDHIYLHEAHVNSGVIFDITDASLAFSTEETFGLSLRNAVSAGWELVPYSFVVDWFYDVGSWLNAVNPRPGIEVRGCWTTTKYLQVNVSKIVKASITVNNSPTTTYSLPGGEYREEIWDTNRTANPTLSMVPPEVPGALSFTHLIDSLALTMTKFRSILR